MLCYLDHRVTVKLIFMSDLQLPRNIIGANVGTRIVHANWSSEASLGKRGTSLFFYASVLYAQVVSYNGRLSLQSEHYKSENNVDQSLKSL